MSKASIQSNRGDGYQTLVAFDWALMVLSHPKYEWIEIDAATLPVDDVVIGKADGSKICCQCKKNQTLHKAWSVADLDDELHKASQLLTSDPKASVRFYSRSPFGELASLREFSTTYPDEPSFRANLGIATGETNAQLHALFSKQVPSLSTYDFLRRTTFEGGQELDSMERLLHERLRLLASNPQAAFDAMWTRLDKLGMRADNHSGQNAAIQHRLTKADLQAILQAAGSMLVPSMDLTAIRSSFESTSTIGRVWRRDIGGQTLPQPLVAEIMAAIDAKPKSILLTGQPGSGKTCVMLALQEALEQQAQCRSDRFPLFIQSRDFADLNTAQDRQAQGLQQDWVAHAARLADSTHVVVVIDSLDVLSIAREHKVLDYFLAQMDQLLRLHNVTVITACRDFDRSYDRRIAQRKWSNEFKCQPLNWATDLAPLLGRQGIDTTGVDETTRQLIQNPRELALYVELARQGGSFNVVTSQALAQKYLDTIVQANEVLGNSAMQAIEAIATEMLRLRSLSVPLQRLSASDSVRLALLSHNVLQLTQDGKLTFGHQTLLDVLVISDALRQGKTLSAFIQNLQPVPFVRPSIRNFVAQLATGNRKTFRSQLRTVLTGQHAFHIRRLVAECLAEQTPQDDDWPLIRDFRAHQPDVFQVIYTQATQLAWHHFWMKHLVPILKSERNSDGMSRHVHRVSAWRNDDEAGVFGFWMEVLDTEWVDRTHMSRELAFAIRGMEEVNAKSLTPLLKKLLAMPREEHSFLGHLLAACVDAGALKDDVLWNYIASEVSDEDVLGHQLDKNLHCAPHEFGSEGNQFLVDRMQSSTDLLDLAVETIEKWSRVRASGYGHSTGYHSGFLNETSYSDAHSKTDISHVDSMRVLFDSIEAAVRHHAVTDSEWWQLNRHRLCTNTEGSLRYFAVLACTTVPATNLEMVGRILCDTELLESNLSFELGTLINSAFMDFDFTTQDEIQSSILSINQEDRTYVEWSLRQRAQLFLPIPCYLRTPAAQAVIEATEKLVWPLVRQCSIDSWCGTVSAPFSFEVFTNSSNSAVLRLLTHYIGHLENSFSDFGVGGEAQVGSQLQEAASRHPNRFIAFLLHQWADIPHKFRNDLMNGAATYLAIRHGNSRANGNWDNVKEANPVALTQDMLSVLEKYPEHWHHTRAAAKALESCAHVISDTQTAERLVLLSRNFLTLEEPDRASGSSEDLLTIGINMAKGNAVDSLMILATKLLKNRTPLPETLAPALQNFAGDANPAVRAVMLQRLPYLQSLSPELGWQLFDIAMYQTTQGLWKMAGLCLYHAYHQHFETVRPWLAQLASTGSGKDLETWGRIAALAALSSKLDFGELLDSLRSMDSTDAWLGAASVWSHHGNHQSHTTQCSGGLEAGMTANNQHAVAVARKFHNLFRNITPLAVLPLPSIQRSFELLASKTDSVGRDTYGFNEWLNATSQTAPGDALAAAEIYVGFVRRSNPYLHDHKNNLTQLLTHLFAYAEEMEESDSGEMIQRVVKLQDALLALGVNGIDKWLKAAERL